MNLRTKVPNGVHEIIKKSLFSKSRKELNEIYRSLDQVMDVVRKMDELISSKPDEQTLIQKISDYRETIYHWIKKKGIQPANISFSEKFPEFIDDIQDFIGTLQKSQKEEQSPYRFMPVDSDGWYLRLRKYFKYKAYKISILPRKTLNLFLKIFRKKLKPIRYWMHTIPVGEAVRKAYLNEMLKDLIKSEKQKYQSLLETLLTLKDLENLTDVEIRIGDGIYSLEKLSDQDYDIQLKKLQQEIDARKRKFSKETNDILKLQDKNFLNIMDKADTLELPKKNLKQERLVKKFEKYDADWLENSKGWHRTLFALFDDWLLDLEINQLKYVAYSELFQARKRLEEEKLQYQSCLIRLSEVLNEFETSIRKEESMTRKKLQSIKIAIRKKVAEKIVPEIINQFDSKTLTGIIRQMEIHLEKEINSFSDTRALVKTDQYQHALKEQEINYIKPNELLSFEVYPNFLNLTTQLKNSVFNQLETVINLVPDIDDIVVFSLDTAINASGPDQEQINAENIKIILDGIQRAKNRYLEIEKSVGMLFVNYDDQLIASTVKFTTDAVELMQNENALAIRIKLMKAKAIAQTKSYKEKVEAIISKRKVSFLNLYKEKTYILSKKLRRARKKYFLQPSDAIITQEISEFLNESKNSINQLPVIYRRLYKVEPVTDMDLFIGRNGEFEAVKTSYQQWISGRSSSTAIIGEKWGGLSSFINYLNENMKYKYPVVRICPVQKYYTKDQLFSLLISSLQINQISTQGEIIEYLKNLPSKKIIIIEDIQQLYLRSIDGFNAMLSLIEIINQTQKNIFWLVTCTQYAWNYLVKSIQISDHFHWVVDMKTMDQDEINNIIRKRNQIGGFTIVYIPPEDYKDYKKFKTSNEEEQQSMLEKRFFRRLNDFASSNISMALIFWLLSTRKVTDDHIYVGDFNNPDHSFIHAMNQSRIYILLALILHDGLSLEDLSRVNNQSEEELGFMVSSLVDDGIIIRQSGLFMVNSLIYRNVVSVLKSKNLIH